MLFLNELLVILRRQCASSCDFLCDFLFEGLELVDGIEISGQIVESQAERVEIGKLGIARRNGASEAQRVDMK